MTTWRERFRGRFKCIQGDCDGNGHIPEQVSEDEWTSYQCQFHAEYLFPIESFISQELTAQREAILALGGKLRPLHHCICGSFLLMGEVGYHGCGAFIGNTPVESEGISGFCAALDAYQRAIKDMEV